MALPIYTKPNNDELTVEQLLNVARAQGGQVAEVAEELSNPQRSMLTTVGSGFKKAFTGFLDIIAMPNQIMAGIISPEITVGEAIKKNIFVSDVVFRDADLKNMSTLGKIGNFTTRLAVDILADPLTYVTFGAARGIIGLSSAPKAFAGEKVAAALGVEKGKAIFFSKVGEDFASGYVDAVQKGTHHMYIPQKIKEMQKAGQLSKEFKFNVTAMREAVKEIEDNLSSQILSGRLRKGDAVRAMSNLLEKHPALLETFLDKGGIKFFSNTILSSQRIRGSIAMIPGMSMIDNLTYPIRNKTMALFDRERVIAADIDGGVGRLSDEAIEIAQKNRDLAESGAAQAVSVLERAVRVLGLTKTEDSFLRDAIVHGLEPADPMAAQLWAAANGIEKAGPIRPEVWRAMDVFKEVQQKHQYRTLRDAGMQISNQEGYIAQVLVKTRARIAGQRTGKTTASAAKYTKSAVLVDEDGVRYPTAFDTVPDKMGNVEARMMVNGEEVRKTFKYINSEREIKQINKIADKNQTSIMKELAHLKRESSALGTGAKASIAKETTDEIVKRMKDVEGITAADKKAIAESVSKFIDEGDIDTIIAKRMKNFYKDGLKLKSGGSISVDELEDVIAKLAEQKINAKGSAKFVLSQVNKVLNKNVKLGHIKEDKLKVGKKLDKEAQEVIDELKDQIAKIRQKVLDDGIDEKNLGLLVSQVVGRTAKNPSALRSVLDKLIKNRQLSDDLFNELNDVQRALENDIGDAIEQGGMFVDQISGKALSKARATAKEAKLLGFNFSESATISTMMGIHEAYKVASTRHFMQEMAEKFGKVGSDAPQGWRQVGVTGLKFEGSDIAQLVRGEKGEAIYFNPLVAKYIEDFGKSLSGDEATENVLNAYDKIQNVFKASVTSIFPAFHGRNAISNAFMSYLDIGLHALDPRKSFAAGQMIHHNIKSNKLLDRMMKGDITAGKEYGRLMSKTVFKDVSGYEWSFGELQSVMKTNLVAFQKRNVGQIDQALTMGDDILDMEKMLFETSKVKRGVRALNPISTKNIAVQTGLRVGQSVEDYARTIHFITNLKATGDPLLAAQRTKMFLFDYQNLSNFERTFLRRIVPFYTFTRKNLELQLRAMFTTPGRIAQEIRAVKSIGDYMGAEQLSDEERAMLPQWMQQGLNTVVKREGSHVSVIGSMGLPFEQPFQQFQPNQSLASISPILRLPAELLTGYSAFHGRAISENTNASIFLHAPEYIKDIIGFTEVDGTNKNTGETYKYYVALRPKMMHMIMNMPPTARVISELGALTEPDVEMSLRAGDFLFGFNPRDVNLDVEAQRREKEELKKLENVLIKSGDAYRINRFILKDDE